MTLEKQQLVQNAALDGHYQIVCRQLFAALNSWYITLVDVEDWEWEVNEYRIFVGTREPPMIDEMNDYSVYYCGYNYYFIDNDGTVKRVVNVNFTEYGEQYTSFLKCSKIQTDYLYSNETGFIQVKDSLELDKNLKVHGTATIDLDTEVRGKALINDNLSVHKSVEVYEDLKIGGTTELTGKTRVLSDISIDGDLRLKGEFINTGNIKAGGEMEASGDLKAPGVSTDKIYKFSGTGNIKFLSGFDVTGSVDVSETTKTKNLTVTNNASIGSANVSGDLSVSGNLNVSGAINGLKIRVV